MGHPMSRRSPVGEQTAYPFDERKKWLRAAALAALPCQCVNECPTCTREGAYRAQFPKLPGVTISPAHSWMEAAGAEEAYEWFEFVCAVETRRAVVR